MDPMKTQDVVYKNTNHGGMEQRERERLTTCHNCHRPRIPFGHVLIELWCVFKHCKWERDATKKERESTTHNNNNNNNAPFQSQKQHNVWEMDPMKTRGVVFKRVM